MTAADRAQVAELIFFSTNTWYEDHARPAIFSETQHADVFFDTYERLDPGCGVVVEDPSTSELIGSCFYRIRPTHVSLGIMNSHPDHAGKGIARMLLSHITRIADDLKKPVRLVSSAINLDSYSLYNRAGFVPRAIYQDMFLTVDPSKISTLASTDLIRPATSADLEAIGQLDLALAGIRRDPDYRFYLENKQQFWRLHVATAPDSDSKLTGWMASSGHAGCNMIGPGVAINEETAMCLLVSHLMLYPGRTPVFLVPPTATSMTRKLYAWGARNCELHFQQVRGDHAPTQGILMPTFLPESA
jgi:GNAT superfamily N-acetyltransferase